MKVEVDCCEGNEQYPNHCLKDHCPIYREAWAKVQSSWPFLATGFGNAYGNPSHSHFLQKVKELVGEAKQKNASQEDCERAKRLYNTIFSCGNDLMLEASKWLKSHVFTCKDCQDKFSERVSERYQHLEGRKLCECGLPATWMRHTQFAGKHYFCDIHASIEKERDRKDDDVIWKIIES